MPPLSEKELEESLAAAGNTLLQPPTSPDELLSVLDRTEELLSKVEQSPAKSMQTALSPLMKALVTEKLLRHSSADVKASVASCVSEITRITAPEAPYDDDKMKDIFQLIVSSFENLPDTSSRSHDKRVTVLEIVAKVRSCVIMLDLECDQMIIEMFQHFLEAVRDYHSEVILTSMETIMSLVLEESEDISSDLLSPILAALKKNNEAVLPVAKKLAEKVIQNTADKIRPYITQAVKALNASLDDFSEVVSSLGRANSGVDGNKNDCNVKVQPVAVDGIVETSSKDEGVAMVRSPESSVKDDNNEIGTAETMIDAISMKKDDSTHENDEKAMSDTVSDDHLAQTSVQSEAKLENAEAHQLPCTDEIPGKDVFISATDVEPVDVAKPLDVEKEIELSQSEAPVNEIVDVPSQTQSVGSPNEDQSKEDSLPNENQLEEDSLPNENPSKEDSLPNENQSKEDSLERKENLAGGDGVSDDAVTNKASEEEHVPVAKKRRRSGKKQANKKAPMGRTLTDKGASNKDDGSTSNTVAKSLDQAEKEGIASDKMENVSSLKDDGKKTGRVKPSLEKDILKSSREDRRKDTPTSSKSARDQGIHEETTRVNTKRKRTPGTEKASETIEYGQNLVGSQIKVWWPKDQMFYEGVISSFDSAKKKHQVNYTDGDEELLNLRKQRWEFIKNDMFSDGDQDGENSKHEASSDVKTKKKGNANSESLRKRRKVTGSPKSTTKATATKSAGKSKNDNQAETEATRRSNSKPGRRLSVDDTLKGKNQGASAKTPSGSKDEADEKTPSQLKQVNSQNSSVKSKRKTPQSGKTPGARMGKASASKVKEAAAAASADEMKEKTPDVEKGKSTDNSKSRDSETKTGKKRRK